MEAGGDAHERVGRPSLGELVFVVWALAVFLNAIDSFFGPDSRLWDLARLGIGAFWVLLFATWVVLRVIGWRRRRAERRTEAKPGSTA
jgi:hypothetical protein